MRVMQKHGVYDWQFLQWYLFVCRVNTDKGDVYINDDGTLGEIPDKRAQYSNHMPPDYQVSFFCDAYDL